MTHASSFSRVAPTVPLGGRPGYLLFLLTVGYLLSFFDRQILVVLLDPIKQDLHLTDTHFGLLYGFAFALFYTTLGLAIGRLVDTHNRLRILAASVLLWSLATAACGLADNFQQLFIARMLVGVGEAGLAPVAYSLLADLFGPRKRARAFSIYAMGIYLGTGTAFVLGGKLIHALQGMPPMTLPVLGDVRGWELAFMIAGVPGLFLALALWCAHEPARGAHEGRKAAIKGSFPDFLRHLHQKRRALACHHIGFALHTGAGYALVSWGAAYYGRVHGWSIAQSGLALGLLVLLVGPLGTVSGGIASDRLLRLGVRNAYLAVSATVCVIQAGAVVVMVLAPNMTLALAGTAVAIFMLGMTAGPAGAALQTITPPQLRGQAGGFYTFISNLLGLSLVPLMVALLTDYVFRDEAMVGISLMWVSVAALLTGALLLWAGRRNFGVELAAGPEMPA